MRDVSVRDIAVFLSVLGALALVYAPGLDGPFVFDDRPNLLFNPYVQLESLDWPALRNALFSNDSSLLKRPVPSLTFAFNYFFADGFLPQAFKLTNLLLHALNGLLIYFIARFVVGRLAPTAGVNPQRGSVDLLPAAVSALWLLHPIQLTSVLYVVQRMNSLSAFFVLCGLLVFLAGRTRLEESPSRGLALMLAGVLGGSGLGVLCKENAALLPFYAAVIELSCFSSERLGPRARRRLAMFYGLVIGIPLLAAVAYLVLRPEFILDGYVTRTFDLGQRLLTQPRVLLGYVGVIVLPMPQGLSLVHDDMVVSSGFLRPWTTAAAILAWIVGVCAAVYWRRRAPVFFFSVAWFLAGHMMESTIIALEMVHEHRNYLPSFGILFGLVYSVLLLFRHLGSRRGLTGAVMILMMSTFAFVTFSRAHAWSSTETLLDSLLRHHPNSARAHGFQAQHLIDSRGDLDRAIFHLQQNAKLAPESIGGLAEMARIVISLRLLHSNEPTDQRTEKQAANPIFEATIPDNPSDLMNLEASLYREIERRIEAHPVSSETVATIAELVDCVYSGRSACRELAPRLARWSDLALSNTRVWPYYRAQLFLASARLRVWLGDVENGLRYAELAAATHPNVHYLIQLAELYARLGDRDRALVALDEAQRIARFGFRSDEIETLRTRLRSGVPQRSTGSQVSP